MPTKRGYTSEIQEAWYEQEEEWFAQGAKQ
jgi:hypothetical protein